eukprot:Colp12_sorted_trinity150504_noHs@16735
MCNHEQRSKENMAKMRAAYDKSGGEGEDSEKSSAKSETKPAAKGRAASSKASNSTGKAAASKTVKKENTKSIAEAFAAGNARKRRKVEDVKVEDENEDQML